MPIYKGKYTKQSTGENPEDDTYTVDLYTDDTISYYSEYDVICNEILIVFNNHCLRKVTSIYFNDLKRNKMASLDNLLKLILKILQNAAQDRCKK